MSDVNSRNKKGKLMCNSQSADLIREVVTQKVNANVMFTAWDITLDVQNLARQKNIPTERHRDLKGTIHQEVDQYVGQGVYQRTLRDVGAPVQAFVYHPNGTNASSYVPHQRHDSPKASIVVTATPIVATVPSISAVDDDDDDNKDNIGRKTDARGTVSIPNYLVCQAGFNTGDVAYVVMQQSTQKSTGFPCTVLAVSKQAKAGSPVLTKYTVDNYNNIRITHAQLFAGALTLQAPGVDTYDFEISGDTIIVSKHC